MARSSTEEKNVVVQNKRLEIDAEYDTILYWKQRAVQQKIHTIFLEWVT